MRRTRALVGLGTLVSVASLGCTRPPPPERLEPLLSGRTPTFALNTKRAVLPLTTAEPAQTGSTIALAVLAERPVLLVADEDAQTLRVLDADTLAPHSDLPVAGKPSQIVVASDGRAYVALRDRARVAALEARHGPTGPLERVADVEVPAEPVGLATTTPGDTVLVTSAWGATVTALTVPDLHTRFDVGLAREPRGITVAADGSAAFVTHAMGSAISRVDLLTATGEGLVPEVTEIALGGNDVSHIRRRICCFMPLSAIGGGGAKGDFVHAHRRPPRVRDETRHHTRATSQGFAISTVGERIFAPVVVVVQGNAQVGGYGGGNVFPAHQPALATLEAQKEPLLRIENAAVPVARTRTNFEGGHRTDACFLPRAAAGDAARGLVLVACLGTNEVIAYDASRAPLSLSIRARWKVPAGPAGIAVDSAGGRAFVWSQFDRSVSVLSLADVGGERSGRAEFPVRPKARAPERTGRLPAVTGPRPLSEQAELGRKLFHAAGDARLAGDGRACASCHPDGRDDGLTWPTPHGARQTPMLAGRLEKNTAPYGWQGDTTTVAAHVEQTFTRLGGKGLEGADLEALMAYLSEMPQPPSVPVDEPEQVARGKELFFSEQVGCSVCHTAAVGSDGARHEVGGGAELETPSLRFVSGTAPYFHDGRYGTLRELLVETKGKMGWSADMTDSDISALEAYLRTL